MAKPKTILIISGILVISGIVISFLQSESEMDDLASAQQSLTAGSSMNVSKNLDPMKSKNGVYSIQISDFKDGIILASVLLILMETPSLQNQ
ncbi:hypothetical protein DYY67_2290 [Candidatus Nitrosotalea sp. TS]|uniref:hypothetical protein n=1 Tax=Candidatus Nitrosotalea sp. TS TaxID=2341020 RepID=UPI001C49C64A|nr:hypothetical protein [Candidatus Nitrosotalea sp. TS]NHI03960.1 hypothetical protein [Candidatus Nitrosotalea sp. TS]